MDKEKIVIEKIDEQSVALYQFDEIDGTLIGTSFEVCHPILAKEHYEIVGELTPNGLELYGSEDNPEDDNYPEFKLVDDEDDDE